MKKSAWRHFKNKWLWTLVILAVAIGLTVWMSGGQEAPMFEAATVVTGNVTEIVGVTGAISPVERAELAFEKSGVVAKVMVKVGDVVKRGDTLASLENASERAALASAQATLADMLRSLTPQELAVPATALNNASIDVRNTFHESFVKAQNSVFNYADSFFSNPQTSNPVIYLPTNSYGTQLSINRARVEVSDVFDKWSRDISGSVEIAPGVLAVRGQGYLESTKGFLVNLSDIVNFLTPGNSNMSQAQIAEKVSIMNTSISTVNTAIDAMSTAAAGLATAHANYDFKLSGSSSESAAAQAARVAEAQASLDQTTLVSPMSGIVTKVAPKAGEFVGAGQSGFTVQNTDFKIEAYVPEADIAKVAIGNLASSTLDAYGSDTDFPAQVMMIDPAETVIEGVPTYKVTLEFVAPDARIRSGMTANLDILTHMRSGVLMVPYRAVVDTDGQKSVRLVSPDGQTYASVSVMTGLKGSNGTIEILSGLSAGDKVVTYVK